MAQIEANGITLEYDVIGPDDGAPLLLIMGLGAQMTLWTQGFRDELVRRGFRVIRFDNRDAGLSTAFEEAGAPDLREVVAARMRGERPKVPYTLDDMAADAAGLLDALGIDKAHVVGASMGGMIAQLVVADYPERTLSFTSIMSTTGNPALPQATSEAMAVLSNRPPHPSDEAAFLEHSLRSARVIGSPGYPSDEARLREQVLSDARRSYRPSGFARQIAAITATGDRREKLKRITAPTVVIHGEADPLVPLAGGRDTAACIPGAELIVIPGMGHDVPPALYGQIADAIAAVAMRAGHVAPGEARLEKTPEAATP